MKGRILFVTAWLPCLALTACLTTTGAATVTEKALCVAWRDSLPSRSINDTADTRKEISYAYDVQAAACPKWPRY